jgi:hypothetical protein
MEIDIHDFDRGLRQSTWSVFAHESEDRSIVIMVSVNIEDIATH